MKKKLLWMTETAVMLALLVAVQAVTKPFGQAVTGSLVNCVLAVTALVVGLSGGLTVGLVSPWLAYLLDIAPSPFALPVIMVGNCLLVLLLWALGRKSFLAAWLCASAAKFAVMFALMRWVICGLLAQTLAVPAKMAGVLIQTFSWLQLLTALIGTGLALAIAPLLKKALKK